MNFKSTVAIFLLVVVLMFTTDSINGFRKPPFNGSIFGKRTISYPGTIYTKNSYDTANVHYEQLPKYENPGKTIYTMCEIASDACQTWFPVNIEKK